MKDSGALKVTARSDREIVMTRVFDAPRNLVFDAYTKPELSSAGSECSAAIRCRSSHAPQYWRRAQVVRLGGHRHGAAVRLGGRQTL